MIISIQYMELCLVKVKPAYNNLALSRQDVVGRQCLKHDLNHTQIDKTSKTLAIIEQMQVPSTQVSKNMNILC